MTTTLEMYARAKPYNYCTNPILDVEILPDEQHCGFCDHLIKWKQYDWTHVDETVPDHSHKALIVPKTRCRYCHSDTVVHRVAYRRPARFRAIECDRCGGVDGYVI